MLCVPSVPTLTIWIGMAGKSTGEAGEAKWSTWSTVPSTCSGRLTSCRISSKRGWPSRWATLPADPVTRLSMPTTSQPRSSSRSHRCEAMKPAAPETTARVTSVPADAPVDEAQPAHLVRVVDVPAVHHDGPAHQALELHHL